MPSAKQKLVLEVSIVTASLVAVTSVLFSLQSVPFIGKYFSLIFALLFLYVPVIVLSKMGREIDFLDRSIFLYFRSLLVFLIAAIIVFPPFFLCAHGWERLIYKAQGPFWRMLPDLLRLLAYQFVIVSLPEEFFFRGYMQSTLNRVLVKRWRFLGADLGWAWIVTAAVFAVAHSIIVVEWWHFAIFFPALLFGYLKERTGSITAPILFHGASNVIMAWIGNMYH